MSEEGHRLHFQWSAHCAFCRMRLPTPNYYLDFVPSESTAWEYKVLGFCDIADSNHQPRIVTIPLDLTDADSFKAISVTFKSGQSLTIRVCLESPCAGEKIAYLVHLSCWKLVNVSNTNPTTFSIYEFARSTYPLFEPKYVFEDRDTTVIDFANPFVGTNAQTELGRLLSSLSQLPVEIQLAISELCTSSLVSSLLTAVNISSTLLSKFKDSPGQTISDLISNDVIDTICTESISIFGLRFLSLLKFGDPRGVLLKRSAAKGIKFVLGRYGLLALSILYANGTTSPWVGDTENGWFGVIYGHDIGRLRILQDNLKYLKIEFADEIASSETLTRVMWDKDLYFTSTQLHHMLETVNARQIRGFRGWRLCAYLPFVDDGGYISGLTMYSNTHSITGIVAHGETNRSIGLCQGCPIHLSLRPNERIVSVWLRIPVDHFNFECDPSILVTTSHKRTCLFGPSLHPITIQRMRYSWTCLSQDSGSEIIGIFYDVLPVKSSRGIENIGVTKDRKPGPSLASMPALPRIPTLHYIPRIRGGITTGGYLSIGNLCYIQSLKLRRSGARLTGMSITHDDGDIEILGQWDPSSPSPISEIYNRRDGVLTSIAFSFVGEDDASWFVDGISVGVDYSILSGDSLHWRVFDIGGMDKPVIMWWFTRLYDIIEPWSGVYQEINVSSHGYRIVDLV